MLPTLRINSHSRLHSLLLVAVASSGLASTAVADETGMAEIHSWRVERGKFCLIGHFHTGIGQGRTKRRARRSAISDWQGFTAWEYGTTWARFRRAASKSISYTRTDSGWEARVDARACKPRRSKRRRRR